MIFMIKISQFITHFCNTQNENHLFIAPKIFDTFTKLLYLLMFHESGTDGLV